MARTFPAVQRNITAAEVCECVLQIEVAAMVFLERYTLFLPPRVFYWTCDSGPTNTVVIGYALMEKLQGTPLD
jgi:hypothetical protein